MPTANIPREVFCRSRATDVRAKRKICNARVTVSTLEGLLNQRHITSLLASLIAMTFSCLAQREPVLKQIDLPHPYYYREMYLPQLTTGPGAVAWSPDYKPDCTPDSKWIIYSSYVNDAVELWVLDLRDKKAHQLTSEGAVNLEPRF